MKFGTLAVDNSASSLNFYGDLFAKVILCFFYETIVDRTYNTAPLPPPTSGIFPGQY
jgi:hypothetical protein